MRVFLTGFMGAGKSAVGARLAARLDLEFVDLDAEIESAAGCSIAELFARDGEAGFRRLERSALERVARRENVVVATGGGTVAAADNRELIASAGAGFWLDVELSTLLDRLASAPPGERPLYRDRRQAAELYESRLDGYRASGSRVPVTAAEDAEEVAARIAARLRETPCAT